MQERLIKNKSLYNVVDPALTNKYLQSLVATLDTRIQHDKAVLFHFAELRREVGGELPTDQPVATVFRNYCEAYAKVGFGWLGLV